MILSFKMKDFWIESLCFGLRELPWSLFPGAPTVSRKIPSHPHTAVIDSPQSTLLINRDNIPNQRSVCLDLVYVN